MQVYNNNGGMVSNDEKLTQKQNEQNPAFARDNTLLKGREIDQ